jgi:hypothetical protein
LINGFYPVIFGRLAPGLREYSFDLGGAYLCKAKTAEYEFESDAPEVRFDTSQTLFQYFFVTFERHFVTVGPVVI